MQKNILLNTTVILLLSACGGGSNEKEEIVESTETIPPLSVVSFDEKFTTTLEKMGITFSILQQDLNTTSSLKQENMVKKIDSSNPNLSIISKDTTTNILDKATYVVDVNGSKGLITTTDNPDLELAEETKGVIVSSDVNLPVFPQGFINIDLNSTQEEMVAELIAWGKNGGASVTSYNNDDVPEHAFTDMNVTIPVSSTKNGVVSCLNYTSNEINDLNISAGTGAFTIPTDEAGEVGCTDKDGNVIPSTDVFAPETLGAISVTNTDFSYDAYRETKKNVKFSDLGIVIDTDALKAQFVEKGLLGEAEDFNTTVYIEVDGESKELFEGKTLVLSKGEYPLSYTIALPNREVVEADVLNPVKVTTFSSYSPPAETVPVCTQVQVGVNPTTGEPIYVEQCN